MNYSCTQDTAACTGIHPLTTSSAKGYCHVLPGLRSVMHFSEANLPVPPLRAKRFKTVQHQWSILDPMYFEDEWALSHQVLSISQLLLLHTQRESKKSCEFCCPVWLHLGNPVYVVFVFQILDLSTRRHQVTCPISHSVQLTCAEFPVKLWRTQNVSSSSTLVSKLTPQTFFPEKKTNLYQSKVKRFPNQGV